MIYSNFILTILSLIIIILLLVFGIMLVPSIGVYLINKSKQKTIKIIEKNSPLYIPMSSGNMQQGTMPEIKVNISLDDILKNNKKEGTINTEIENNDEEEKALKKLEERKTTFVPFEDRKDIKVDFDDFGNKFELKE